MLQKVFDMTQDKHITAIIGALLTNRRFTFRWARVEADGGMPKMAYAKEAC